MAIDALHSIDIIETMENFLNRKRPPENIRDKIDISYKLEGQSIIIFEIRPQWNKPKNKIETPVAKTTFVKSKIQWKVFWMRGNLKWYPYEPQPFVYRLADFLELVERDEYGCFWG